MKKLISKPLSESKHIYVLENSDRRVKIGVSKNIKQRIRALETGSSYKMINVFYTAKCSNSNELESLCHKHFKNFKIRGEWFDVPFETAKEYVKNLNLEFNFRSEEESKKRVEKFFRRWSEVGLQKYFKFSYSGKVYRINRNKVKKYDKEILSDIDGYIESCKEIEEYDWAKEYEELKNNYNRTKDIDLLIYEYIRDCMGCMPSSTIDELCNDTETEFYSEILQEIPKEIQNLIYEFGYQVLTDEERENPCSAIQNKIQECLNDVDILYSADWGVIDITN